MLWSPTETVLRGLERNSSRPCWNATAGNSWFSIRGTSAPREELTADLIAILTVFEARVNGLRRYRKEISEYTSLPGRQTEG